jgi:hypothetical protein
MAKGALVWRSACRTTATADLIPKFAYRAERSKQPKQTRSFAAQNIFRSVGFVRWLFKWMIAFEVFQ